LPWIDDFVDLRDAALTSHGSPWVRGARSGEGPTVGRGSITVYVPDIGGLLPVFVLDRYEGFEVKTFPQLTDVELASYIDANVSAVGAIVESLGGVDAAVASHLVMGPVVLARAGLRCALKVHGSDLSYTVLPHLERFRPYALEAAANATAILVSTAHVAARFRLAVDDPWAEEKLRLAPPGVDAELFSPIPRREAGRRLGELAAEVGGNGESAPEASAPADSWRRDDAQAAAAVDHLAQARGPRIVFVGKLIVSKGVDLLLAAWPLVHARHPDARLLIVGFGAYEEGLNRLWSALTRGDLVEACRGAGDSREGRRGLSASWNRSWSNRRAGISIPLGARDPRCPSPGGWSTTRWGASSRRRTRSSSRARFRRRSEWSLPRPRRRACFRSPRTTRGRRR
jgi:glycosyltransferase involved in cell wall biosynthesis